MRQRIKDTHTNLKNKVIRHKHHLRLVLLLFILTTLAITVALITSRTFFKSKGSDTESLPNVAIAIMSDSTSDEYRADDNRGNTNDCPNNTNNWCGETTFSWDELLVKYRNFNIGSWSTRAEPRRTGYEYNFSRSGATASTLLSQNQHNGVKTLVTDPTKNIQIVYIQIGSNDFSIYTNFGTRPGYDICTGTLTGTSLQNKIDTFLSNVTTAVTTIRNANSGVRIILATVGNPIKSVWGSSCPKDPNDPDYLNNPLTITVKKVNEGIRQIAQNNNAKIVDLDAFAQNILSKLNSNNAIAVGGKEFSMQGGNSPLHITLSDNIHAGTVFGGLFANEVIKVINSSMGTTIPIFSDNELLSFVKLNLTTPTPTPSPTPSPTTGVPTLIKPTNGATDVVTLRPTFEWTPVVGATNYTIQVANSSVFNSTTVTGLVNKLTGSIEPKYTPLTDLQRKGVLLYWRVRAEIGSTHGVWSNVSTFTSANPPSIPVLTLPISGSVSRTTSPTLVWKVSTPTPKYYHLQISKDETFATVTYENKTINAQTTGSTYTFKADGLSKNTTYYWRVRAISEKGEISSWQKTSYNFKIVNFAPKVSNSMVKTWTYPSSLMTFNYDFTGTNKLLMVAAGYRTTSSKQITSIKYGGVSLTKIKRLGYQQYVSELWYLKPNLIPSGNQFVITTNGSLVEPYTMDSIQIIPVTLTGVNQTTPFRSTTPSVAGANPTPYVGSGVHDLNIPTFSGELPFSVHTTYYNSGNKVSTNLNTVKTNALKNTTTIVNAHEPNETMTKIRFSWNTTQNWPWSAIGVSVKSP